MAFDAVCRGIWQTPQNGRIIVLSGPNGTGKTHFTRALARWIEHVGHAKKWELKGFIHHLDCAYWLWARLLDTLKSGSWELIDELVVVSVLLLDDLGAAYDPSELGTDKLCQLLSQREDKWTVVTTNICPKDWESKFDKRISSRFLRNSLIVDLTGVPDFNA